MSLNSVSAVLSTSGSPTTLTLVHKETGEVVRTLNLVPAESQHRSFLLSTWLKSYRPQARKDGISEYYDRHEAEIAESRWEDCFVLTDEDGFTVYAWVCGYPGSLYHVYVVPELRNVGVARRLIEHACGDSGVAYARNWPGRPRGYKVNPYLLVKKNG